MFVEGVGRFWEYIHRWTRLYTSESDLVRGEKISEQNVGIYVTVKSGPSWTSHVRSWTN